MPELPEVETVVRDLRPLLIGRSIVAVTVGKQKLRRAWKKSWEKELIGTQVVEIRRRGKWILVGFGRSTLLVHLGMTGQFTAVPTTCPMPDHTHFVFDLDDATQLRYRDIRRFGSIEWFPIGADLETQLGEKLGPEPEVIDPETFRTDVRSSKRTMKAILLDQAVVAGVGNIYADESLFRANLHPTTRGQDVPPEACDRLRLAIQDVILRAIENRGSTIRDYVGGSGLKGGFQHEFAVYGRDGEACPTCTTPIEVIRVAGRSSHYCPTCQPEGSSGNRNLALSV
jgi:formamidopyrimidine-DNA glycosylase